MGAGRKGPASFSWETALGFVCCFLTGRDEACAACEVMFAREESLIYCSAQASTTTKLDEK
jgi:hypothetical protein